MYSIFLDVFHDMFFSACNYKQQMDKAMVDCGLGGFCQGSVRNKQSGEGLDDLRDTPQIWAWSETHGEYAQLNYKRREQRVSRGCRKIAII